MSISHYHEPALLHVLLAGEDRDDAVFLGIAVDQEDVNIWLQTARGVAEAIEYLEGKDRYADRALHPLPDVLLLDLTGPELEGYGFLAWRKRFPELAQLPVTALCDPRNLGQIDTALSFGADFCLAKPTDLEGWKRLVREVWATGLRHLSQGSAGDRSVPERAFAR